MSEKFRFEILDPNADGRNSLLNPEGEIAVLRGKCGEVVFKVEGDINVFWNQKSYESCADFPEDLIECLTSEEVFNYPQAGEQKLKKGILHVDLSNCFQFEVRTPDGDYIDDDGLADDNLDYRCDKKTGEIDFDYVKTCMINCYNDVFEDEIKLDNGSKEEPEGEELEFEIEEFDVDGRNSLLNDSGVCVASLSGSSGEVEVVVSGDTKISWDGEDYTTPDSFPDDLIKYLQDPEKNKALAETHNYYESLTNWFNCFAYDSDDELVCDDTIDLKCDASGKVDFNDLKNQMVDYYKEAFEDEITQEEAMGLDKLIEKTEELSTKTTSREDLSGKKLVR